MKQGITKRQKELLSIIYQYIGDSGYPPTFEDMRAGLGVASNQSVVDLLKKLKSGGYVKRDEGARSIAVLPLGYEALGEPPFAPFLGATSAGALTHAFAIDGEWMKMPSAHYDSIERLQANVFVLRVNGDSMINAGINDGDRVLVQEKKEFLSGDIVLAYDGDDATIKRFMSVDEAPYIFLQPENPKYDKILFTDNMRMTGKVVSVLRAGEWAPLT